MFLKTILMQSDPEIKARIMSNGSVDVSKECKEREIGRDDYPKTGCVRNY